jgi:OOP family OmpA-OmpF porin
VRWVGLIGCALGLTMPAIASADPRLEASGFIGIDYFGDNIQLGNSWAQEQIPGTAPVLGARLTYLAVPALWARDAVQLDLGIEGELAIAPAFTGGNFDGGRMAYFAPVFGWRGHALLRLAGLPHVRPHLVAGLGGETVASSSPFMAKETDPVFYWGAGATVPVSERWQLRLDVRHGIMPARRGTVTSTFEVQLGISTTFGLAQRRVAPRPVERVVIAAPPVDETDRDEDGLPDRLDTCPHDAETVNGIDDDDGCPEPDPDGDGLVGASDKCPLQAEDFDHFEDDDGCPELDNDKDGVADARDTCPLEPETRNGIDDDDGCPDVVPADVLATLGAGAAVKFPAASAKLSAAAKKALEDVSVLLRERTALKIMIIGHPDKGAAEDVAKRRAEAVKWYLVDQGIAADQIATSVAVGVAKGPAIELQLPAQ